jgi:hypothetical protein
MHNEFTAIIEYDSEWYIKPYMKERLPAKLSPTQQPESGRYAASLSRCTGEAMSTCQTPEFGTGRCYSAVRLENFA